MATPDTSCTPQEAAELAQAEHSRLAELLMMTVDMIDEAQQHGRTIKVANLRKLIGPDLRKSAEAHALCVAFLLDKDGPEYADRLVAYADEMATTGSEA